MSSIRNPIHPRRFRTFIHAEIGDGLVALFDVDAPGQRIFVDLSVAQPVRGDTLSRFVAR